MATSGMAARPDVWVLSDGKAGDEQPCLGVAEAMGVVAQIRRIAPRPPFSWTAPWGPIDPREAPPRPGSPIRPPFPDILIASGRRAAPYVRQVKKASGGKTFTVILKDPRAGTGAADFLWVPRHDRLRGPNVLATLTSPHRLSRARLDAARNNPPKLLADMMPPRAAVLVGGNSRHFSFSEAHIRLFAERLARLADSGVSLMGTLSRRTPDRLATATKETFAAHGGWLWDGTGENPLIALLALADAVIVTADSVNMVGEAAATGRPVLVFTPSGRGHRKISNFLDAMREKGVVHNFTGRLEGRPYPPLDSTPAVAAEILRRYRLFRNAS